MKLRMFAISMLLLQIVQSNGQSAFWSDGGNVNNPERLAQFISGIEKTDWIGQEKENQNCVIIRKGPQSNKTGLIFDLKVANDMTFFTDQYFSSGVELKVFAPFVARSPLNKIMLPHQKGNLNYFALTFTHNLYTPIYIDTLSARKIDHPFAAYFLFGNRKESYNPIHRFKLSSELQLGIIGPAAGGHVFQNTLHEFIPIAGPVEGWNKQISNDICLQYSATMEKGIIDFDNVELNAIAGAKLGVPHTEAQLGIYCRLGYFDDYFQSIGIGGDANWQVWLFCSGDASFVAYNAVLQGGIFNHGEPNTLHNINHILWHSRFGGTLVYKSMILELAQEVLSPSFPTGLWHRWAYISFMVGF